LRFGFRAYFAEDGIEYNMGRVPLAGTDFSTHTYSYANVPGDTKMNFFQLTKEDLEFKASSNLGSYSSVITLNHFLFVKLILTPQLPKKF